MIIFLFDRGRGIGVRLLSSNKGEILLPRLSNDSFLCFWVSVSVSFRGLWVNLWLYTEKIKFYLVYSKNCFYILLHDG